MTAGKLQIMLQCGQHTYDLRCHTSKLMLPKVQRVPEQHPVILALLRMARFVIPRARIIDWSTQPNKYAGGNARRCRSSAGRKLTVVKRESRGQWTLRWHGNNRRRMSSWQCISTWSLFIWTRKSNQNLWIICKSAIKSEIWMLSHENNLCDWNINPAKHI